MSYAAAKGCLECVKLLIESYPKLKLDQEVIYKEKIKVAEVVLKAWLERQDHLFFKNLCCLLSVCCLV